MQHVTLDELMACGFQQVPSGYVGMGDNECHDVLQLIPKAEGATRLIQSRATPHAARQRLV
jgi:hypothetical protein